MLACVLVPYRGKFLVIQIFVKQETASNIIDFSFFSPSSSSSSCKDAIMRVCMVHMASHTNYNICVRFTLPFLWSAGYFVIVSATDLTINVLLPFR